MFFFRTFTFITGFHLAVHLCCPWLCTPNAEHLWRSIGLASGYLNQFRRFRGFAVLSVHCLSKIFTGGEINSLAPGKFEWNFRYAIFKLILEIDGWGISYEIALIWMSLDFTDDQSTLVQVMAWCRQAISHYLSQCWPRSLSPYGVTRPEWVKQLRFSDPTLGGFSTWNPDFTMICLECNLNVLYD